MAGNKTIYLVYDQTVEDEKSLQEFITKILTNAGYPLASLYLIDKTKVTEVIDDSDRQFFICINSTYVPTTIQLARNLEITPHRFFSRFYKDPDKKILALGLIYTIKEILSSDQNTKLTVWEKVKSFLAEYLDYIEHVEEVDEAPETVSDDTQEEIEDIPVQEELPLAVKLEEPVEAIIGDIALHTIETYPISAITDSLSINDVSAVTYSFASIKSLPLKEKIKLLSELQSNILNEFIDVSAEGIK